MRMLSPAQITKEIEHLKKIVAIYYQHNVTDMIDDIERRILDLERLLEPAARTP